MRKENLIYREAAKAAIKEIDANAELIKIGNNFIYCNKDTNWLCRYKDIINGWDIEYNIDHLAEETIEKYGDKLIPCDYEEERAIMKYFYVYVRRQLYKKQQKRIAELCAE